MNQVSGQLFFQRNNSTGNLTKHEFEVPKKFSYSGDRRYVWYTDETKWYSLSSSVFEKFKDHEYRHRFLWAMGHYVDEIYPIVGKDVLVVRYKGTFAKLNRSDGNCWRTLVQSELAQAKADLDSLKEQHVSSKNKKYVQLDNYVRYGTGLMKSKKFFVRIYGSYHPLNHIQSNYEHGFKEVDGVAAFNLMQQYGFDTHIIDNLDINLSTLVDYEKPHYQLVKKMPDGIQFFDTELEKVVSFKYKTLKYSANKPVEAFPVIQKALKKYMDEGILIVHHDKFFITKKSLEPEITQPKGKKIKIPSISYKFCNPVTKKYNAKDPNAKEQSYYVNPNYKFRIKLRPEISIAITPAEDVKPIVMTNTIFKFNYNFKIILDQTLYSLKEEIQFPLMSDTAKRTEPWFLNNWFYSNLAAYADECYDLVLEYFKFKEEASKKIYVDIILSRVIANKVSRGIPYKLVYPIMLLKPSNVLATTFPKKRVFTLNMDDVYIVPRRLKVMSWLRLRPVKWLYVKELKFVLLLICRYK